MPLAPVTTVYWSGSCASTSFLKAATSFVRCDQVIWGRKNGSLVFQPRTAARSGPTRGTSPSDTLPTGGASEIKVKPMFSRSIGIVCEKSRQLSSDEDKLACRGARPTGGGGVLSGSSSHHDQATLAAKNQCFSMFPVCRLGKVPRKLPARGGWTGWQ